MCGGYIFSVVVVVPVDGQCGHVEKQIDFIVKCKTNNHSNVNCPHPASATSRHHTPLMPPGQLSPPFKRAHNLT